MGSPASPTVEEASPARRRRRDRALDRLAGARRSTVWGLALGAVLLVAVADWFCRAEVAASLAYLLPISLAAWGRGRGGAAVIAALSASAWLVVDVQTHWLELVTVVEIVNGSVLLITFMLFGQLLSTLRERLDVEHRLASTDPLTGIHNRRALWNATAREIERCRRTGDPFSVAYLDVDGFKGVNDCHGHGVGDELLRDIATTMQAGLRPLDMVARLGGDEFAVLLPGADADGAEAAIGRLRERLRAASWRPRYAIDFSLGCLTVLVPPADVDALVGRADELMYAMKRSGRGSMRHQILGEDSRPTTVLIPRATVPRGSWRPLDDPALGHGRSNRSG